MERAERGRGGPLVPVEQNVFGLRFVPSQNAAVGAGLDVSRLRNPARPRRERGEKYPKFCNRRGAGDCEWRGS